MSHDLDNVESAGYYVLHYVLVDWAHFAVLFREGHQEATRLLLDSGAQINVPSGSNDDTPLTLACWKGHEEVVSLLIERNSNVNHQTKTGCTPLMEATRLVSVCVCACVCTGCTPLMEATRSVSE